MSQDILLFMHAPRTARTTVGSILAEQYGPARVRGPCDHDRELLALPQAKRDALACVFGGFGFGIHRHFTRRCKYVTMLRDPVDAVVSCYFSVKNDPRHPWHGALVAQRMTLREYAEGGECGHTDNYQLRFLTGRARGARIGRAELELAKHLLVEGLATFGLVERFDESMLLFKRSFGWKTPYYVRQNVGQRPEDLRTVTNEDRLVVACRHALDRELIAFARDLFTARVRAAGDGFLAELATFRRVNYGYDQLDRLGLKLRPAHGRFKPRRRYPWLRVQE